MRHIIGIFLTLFMFHGRQSFGQSDTLNMIQTVVWNHTLEGLNANVSVNVTAVNDANIPFSDTIVFFAKLNNAAQDSLTSNSAGFVTLQPNDTVSVQLNWVTDPTKFVPGNNITVIWPANNNILSQDYNVSDSLILITFIDTTLGIINISAPTRIDVYPNPTNDVFYLKTSVPDGYRKLSIYNSSGQMVYGEDENVSQYDISSLPNGHYILHIEDKDGHILIGQLVVMHK